MYSGDNELTGFSHYHSLEITAMFLQEKHRNKKYVEQYALIMENSKKQGRIYVVPELGLSSQLSPICETMSLAEYVLMVS